MADSLAEHYEWIEVLHIIAAFAWMAGMFYLPRLYAYHATVKPGSEASEIFKVMERRLLRIIINPAMLVTLLAGATMAYVSGLGAPGGEKWIHVKLLLVLAMVSLHGWFAVMRKDFEHDRNTRSPKFYKIINELPTLLLVGIVALVVIKPF